MYCNSQFAPSFLTGGARDDESELCGDDYAVERLVVAGEDGARRRPRLPLAPHDRLRARVPVPQQHRAVLKSSFLIMYDVIVITYG